MATRPGDRGSTTSAAGGRRGDLLAACPARCSFAALRTLPHLLRSPAVCSGLWAIKKKNGGKFPTHAKKAAEPAAASKKPAKFYAAGEGADDGCH